MRLMKLGDTTLGISKQATEVLKLLGKIKIPSETLSGKIVWTSTAALYNCRERGICLTVTVMSKQDWKYLNVFFAENRSSDDIRVLHWMSDNQININPPTVDSIPEAAWDDCSFFINGNYRGAADYVYELVSKFFDESEK